MSYRKEFDASINEPEAFWKDKAEALKWYKFPENILSKDDDDIYHWFEDGEMNTSYMALDYHVEQGRGDQDAIIYDSYLQYFLHRWPYGMGLLTKKIQVTNDQHDQD